MMLSDIRERSFDQTGDVDAILKEENPFIREIWAAGYTHLTLDCPMNKLVLVHQDGTLKEIDFHEFRHVVYNCRVFTGVLYAGKIHSWIKESDGSAERFRNLINRQEL